MTLQIDQVITKKLLLVKQLYLQSLLQAKVRQSDVGRITTIVIFDLAIETMLKTITLALDPKKDPDETFEALIQQADDLMMKAGLLSLPNKTPIRHVHSIRNDAQHKARYPSDAEVNDCRTYTRDFLTAACSQIWGEQFEKISMLDLIQHEDVKAYLSQAEKSLSENDLERALAHAKEGVNQAIYLASKVVATNLYSARKEAFAPDRVRADTFECHESYLVFKEVVALLEFRWSCPYLVASQPPEIV